MTDILRRKVFSAGGAVLRKHGERYEVALIRTRGNVRFQLPKGLLDPGETSEEAALREVREETGIRAVLSGHLKTLSYSFSADYGRGTEHFDKTVDFFLMRYGSGNISDHDDEVEEVVWMDLDHAAELMLYQSEMEALSSIDRTSLDGILN